MNETSSLTLEEITLLTGSVVIEFGVAWCSHCQAAQTIISAALIKYPNIKHIKIEDGKGKRLGRQFLVKLWPTLIFLENGVEVVRIVRPQNEEEILVSLNLVSQQL